MKRKDQDFQDKFNAYIAGKCTHGLSDTQACPKCQMASKGTPTSLKEAIHNGIIDEAAKFMHGLSGNSYGTLQELVEIHVRDFLAQRIGAALLSSKSRDVETALIDLSESIGIEVRK